jgi:hypothetical protein
VVVFRSSVELAQPANSRIPESSAAKILVFFFIKPLLTMDLHRKVLVMPGFSCKDPAGK